MGKILNPFYLENEFFVPQKGYMAGNSLGPGSQKAMEANTKIMSEWNQMGVEGWHTDAWIKAPQIAGAKIAPIIGAKPEHMIVVANTTINLHQLTSIGLDGVDEKRNTILTDSEDFPANRFGAQSYASGGHYKVTSVPFKELADAMNDNVAVLSISHVDFRTGEVRDMKAITALAREHGIRVLWDLSHSAGVLPVDVEGCDVDMAVGCTYKYLNGGIGAPGFAYINKERMPQKIMPALYGWLGHKDPFNFDPTYVSADDMSALICGTPPIISLRILDGALGYYDGIDMHEMYKVTQQFTGALIETIPGVLAGARCLTPTDPAKRGGHVAFFHKEAEQITRACKDHGLVMDFRKYVDQDGAEGGVMRMGVHPLYMDDSIITNASEILMNVVGNKIYKQEKYQKRAGIVT